MAGGMSLQSLAPNAGQGMLTQGMGAGGGSSLKAPQTPPPAAAAKAWEQPAIPYEAPQNIRPLSMPSQAPEQDTPPGWGFLRAYLGK